MLYPVIDVDIGAKGKLITSGFLTMEKIEGMHLGTSHALSSNELHKATIFFSLSLKSYFSILFVR